MTITTKPDTWDHYEGLTWWKDQCPKSCPDLHTVPLMCTHTIKKCNKNFKSCLQQHFGVFYFRGTLCLTSSMVIIYKSQRAWETLNRKLTWLCKAFLPLAQECCIYSNCSILLPDIYSLRLLPLRLGPFPHCATHNKLGIRVAVELVLLH